MVADVTSSTAQSVLAQYSKPVQQGVNAQTEAKDTFKADGIDPKTKEAPAAQTQKSKTAGKEDVKAEAKVDGEEKGKATTDQSTANSKVTQGSTPLQRGSLIDVLA